MIEFLFNDRKSQVAKLESGTYKIQINGQVDDTINFIRNLEVVEDVADDYVFTVPVKDKVRFWIATKGLDDKITVNIERLGDA